MALASAKGALECAAAAASNDDVVRLLTGAAAQAPSGGYAASGAGEMAPLPPPRWPDSYTPIRRVKFTDVEDMLDVMKPQAKDGVPLIIENSGIIQVDKWADASYVQRLLGDTKVLVKKSANEKFRYYDLKKNSGKYDFQHHVEEKQQTVSDFLCESKRIYEDGSKARMYMQETLSGHAELAEEFASWRWELPIRISRACGWGLPDSNELFVGMQGAETPLHFDERENLFFQIRGLKEVVVFPFTDYPRLYPFPTTHPCDRQSMVGSPLEADLEAFPNFSEAKGHYATLKAGDLLYLPYGWWHWLRNLEHLTTSISFWSTTPATDLSGGIPDTFSEHMLTRVRRNLESMIAQDAGYENHNKSMLQLAATIESGKEGDPTLTRVRSLLAAVKMPLERQDKFLLEIIEGRFGIDWNKHV
eukprot:TRINITY_DN94622_c0_g1_i1.p1 TRINITY_DN94622_c0_g1~~TRINITY_DN94622_c0_g1_i1.p1  ORF type:complete len:436 (+),score=95.78 TRINITY_DN94622_c0_g1_i1:58-1308(+)